MIQNDDTLMVRLRETVEEAIEQIEDDASRLNPNWHTESPQDALWGNLRGATEKLQYALNAM